MISNGRIFIGTECVGDKLCCSCGRQRAKLNIKKSIKTTFTDFTQLITNPSLYICDSCIKLYNDKNMRFKPIYSDHPGTYQVIDRNEVLKIIRNPPKKFVLSVPYSFKKHHWLYAGVSSPQKAYIGTDDRTVVVDYKRFNVTQIIDNVQDCVNYGIPRNEIITGNYSTFTLSKFSFIKDIEKIYFSEARSYGLIELAVKYTPAIKNKKIYENEEENQMLTPAEINAVNLLGLIASGSEYRVSNGLQFWDGYFERRINRYKNLNAHEFISNLTEAIGTNHISGYQNMVQELSENDLQEIMNCIRKETHLLVSIVYSERKKDQ